MLTICEDVQPGLKSQITVGFFFLFVVQTFWLPLKLV